MPAWDSLSDYYGVKNNKKCPKESVLDTNLALLGKKN